MRNLLDKIVSYFDLSSGHREIQTEGDGAIRLQPEILDRALALAGTDRTKLAALAAQEQTSRYQSGLETRKKAHSVVRSAESQFASERARIEQELEAQLRVADALFETADVNEHEAQLHGELAHLLDPAKVTA